VKYSETAIIVKKYIDAVAMGSPNGGIARYESLLPCSKERIVDALKIFLGYAIKNKTFPDDIFWKYVEIVSCINQFIKDEIADIINEMHGLKDLKLISQHKEKAEIFFENRSRLFSSNEFNEMMDFINKVQKIEIDDKNYCIKVYEYAGIKYYPDYEEDFG
jgi:hypothetical protein